MRRPWARYTLAVLLVAGCSQHAGVLLISGCDNAHTARIDFRQVAPAEGVTAVAVDTRNGAVDVNCEPAATGIEVRGTKFASGPTREEADANAAEIQIEVKPDTARPELLRVAAVFPQVPNRNRGASFTITLPPTLKLDLQTYNGRIKVGGAEREVRARTTNGSINFANTRGPLDAKTTNGGIDVRDASGDMRLQTTNGGIEAHALSGGKLKLETSNGRIRCSGIEANGPVTLRTSNDDIDAQFARLADSPRVRAVTSNASVAVTLPQDVKARLTAGTSNGRIHADLKGVEQSDLHSGEQHLEITLNGGGGSIELESSNGSVTIKTAPATRPAGDRLSTRILKRLIG